MLPVGQSLLLMVGAAVFAVVVVARSSRQKGPPHLSGHLHEDSRCGNGMHVPPLKQGSMAHCSEAIRVASLVTTFVVLASVVEAVVSMLVVAAVEVIFLST